MKANTSIYIDPDVKQRLKIRAVKARRSVSEIVREVIDEYLKSKK